jgi:LAO/AO transport system kinase
VVLVPESGDSIQAMKAGLMEIADFFVMNKSDRAGAEQAITSIKMILHFKAAHAWMPDVLRAVAIDGTGIDDIASKVSEHRADLEKGGQLKQRRRTRLEERVRTLVADRLRVDFWTEQRNALLSRRIESVAERLSSPYDLADELIHDFRNDAWGLFAQGGEHVTQ